MIRELHVIALSRLGDKTTTGTQCWYQKLEPSAFGLALYGLALDFAKQDAMADDKILPALVDDDAVPLLLAMPNLFWFWRLVKEAAFCQDDDTARVSKSNVLKALGAIRHIGSLNQVIGDYRRGVVLTPQTTAYLVASGALLSDASTLAIIENPVYFKDHTAEPFRFDY